MAKATDAPNTFSLATKGPLANKWVYCANQYEAYVLVKTRFPHGGYDPQADQYGRVTNAAALWATMTPEQKQAWKPKARQLALPLYTTFITENLRRYFQNLPIIATPA